LEEVKEMKNLQMFCPKVRINLIRLKMILDFQIAGIGDQQIINAIAKNFYYEATWLFCNSSTGYSDILAINSLNILYATMAVVL